MIGPHRKERRHEDSTRAFERYLDEAAHQLAGRTVEVIVEDTAGKPATAITKMHKLVESERVHMVVGPLGTSDLAPYITQIKREAGAAFVIVVAASALTFPSQDQDAGLRGKLPVIGGAVITDQSILPTFGDEALGIVTPLMYSA